VSRSPSPRQNSRENRLAGAQKQSPSSGAIPKQRHQSAANRRMAAVTRNNPHNRQRINNINRDLSSEQVRFKNYQH